MKELLSRIKCLRVLVVGDVMLDRYLAGDVRRISPEAPVPVLTVDEEKSVAGGAANVALNAAALGANVEVLGWFGQDLTGEELIHILEGEGITVERQSYVSGVPTISKTRVMASNQQICRIDREEAPNRYQPNLSDIHESLVAKASASDLVIISDYGKGFVSSELISLLRSTSSFLAIDPKPSRLLDYAKPDLLTPNRIEALELAGRYRFSVDEFPEEEIVSKIFDDFSPRKLAITIGSEGMLLAEEGKSLEVIPTAAQEVFDVSGAGDTVIAALAMCLSAGTPFIESAKFANLAAGIVVGKVGTATVSPQEILSVAKR